MKIEIGDKYVLTSDTSSYMLRKRAGTDKDGKDLFTSAGQFITLQGVAKHIAKLEIAGGTPANLQQLADRLDEIAEMFAKTWEVEITGGAIVPLMASESEFD